MNILLNKQKNTVKKVFFILLTVVISFVLISMLTSVIVFSLLFGRIDVSLNVASLSYSSIDEEKYPRNIVRFNSDGNELCGYIYGLDNSQKCGVVIVGNGIGSDADSHLPEIMYFVDHNWCVFTFDSTGVFNSSGDGIKGLSQSKIDMISAIEYVKNDSDLLDLPIVLYGHSVGGYAAAASLEKETDISAAVCISGFDSPTQMMKYKAKRYVGILADIEYPFMCLHNWFVFGEDSDTSAINAINSTDIPVMLVEGSEDSIVPDKISIGSHYEEITNPNAMYKQIKTPYRNRHSTIWLCDDSAKYKTEIENNMSRETDDSENIDILKANEIDIDFMDDILAFYNNSVKLSND